MLTSPLSAGQRTRFNMPISGSAGQTPRCVNAALRLMLFNATRSAGVLLCGTLLTVCWPRLITPSREGSEKVRNWDEKLRECCLGKHFPEYGVEWRWCDSTQCTEFSFTTLKKLPSAAVRTEARNYANVIGTGSVSAIEEDDAVRQWVSQTARCVNIRYGLTSFIAPPAAGIWLGKAVCPTCAITSSLRQKQ